MTLARRTVLLSGAALLLSACSSVSVAPTGPITPRNLSRGGTLTAINATRAKFGHSALGYNALLEDAARTHANLMASRNKMSHTLGGNLRSRVAAAGYTEAVGENLASGYDTLDGAIQGWLDSPGHRSTLLNDRFSEFGLAAATSSGGKSYWVFIAGGSFDAWRG